MRVVRIFAGVMGLALPLMTWLRFAGATAAGP